MNAAFERRGRVSLLYYSGAGGTRLVAELLGEILAARHEASVTSVHDRRSLERAADANLLVLCYPTYFLRPAPSMREFIGTLGPFDPPREAYLVATYELYTENSIRACALALKERGVRVVGSRAVRAPGSDVTCLVPGRLCPWLYRFEKGLPRKLRSIAEDIGALAAARGSREAVPSAKWYTPLAQLLQVLVLDRFGGWRDRVRVLPGRCTLCGACAAVCDRGAWVVAGGSPVHVPGRCELCTRCIHRCPNRAIVLIAALKDNRRLDSRLYASLEEEARKGLSVERIRSEESRA